MKKLFGVLLVWFGFWITGATMVQAETRPLPPDYDPIQGGMVLRPPKELWVTADNSVWMIPLAYLPGGVLNVDQLKQVHYFVQVNHEERAIPRVANPTYVYIDQTLGWGLGAVETNGLGLVVRADRVGVYPLTLAFQFGQDSNRYETEIILHVVTKISTSTKADTSTEPIFSPLPQLVVWHHLDGEITVANSVSTSLVNNDLKWPSSPLFTFVPPSSQSYDTLGNLLTLKLTTATRQLTVNNPAGMMASQQFGLQPIAAVQGQPIILSLNYIHPAPGTQLRFIWQFFGKNGAPFLKQVTDTPELPAALVPPDALSVQLTLQYFDQQTTVEYHSSMVTYTYRALTRQTLSPAVTTIDIAAIIQGPVTAKAGFSDWSVNQVGSWHFTMTASTLKQANEATLSAQLKWPNGSLIAAGQAYTVNYSGPQVVPLSQIDWVFQQQPQALAGRYQAEILFEAIAGP